MSGSVHSYSVYTDDDVSSAVVVVVDDELSLTRRFLCLEDGSWSLPRRRLRWFWRFGQRFGYLERYDLVIRCDTALSHWVEFALFHIPSLDL